METTINGRISHRIDKKSNWDSSTSTPLLSGEIGVITDSNGVPTGLGVGHLNTGSSMPDLLDNDQIFYPGLGAGYELPTASYTQKGGVTPSQDYYSDPSSLSIKGLTWLSKNGFFNELKELYGEDYEKELSEDEKYLRLQADQQYTNTLVMGDLYARNIIATNITNNTEENKYIKSRLMYLNSDGTYFPDMNGIGFVFLSTEDLDGDGNLDYDTLLLNGGKLTYNNQPFLMLTHTDAYDGAKYYKFYTDGSYDIVNKIPLDDIGAMGNLVVEMEGNSEGVEIYNPYEGTVRAITIPTKWCNRIILSEAPGDYIDVAANHEIDLTGKFVGTITEEERSLILSSLQNIQINNITLNKNNNYLTLSGSETININTAGNTLTFSLNEGLGDKINTAVQSLTINNEKLTGNDLVYDIEGSDTITVSSTAGKSSISLNSDYTDRIDSAIQTIELNGEILNKENNKYSIEGSDSIDITTSAGKSVVTLNNELEKKIVNSAQTLTINGIQVNDSPQFEFDIISGNTMVKNDAGEEVVAESNTVVVKQEGSQLTLSHYPIKTIMPMVPQTINIDKTNDSIKCSLGVTYDKLGHVTDSGLGLLNFSAIFGYIDALEERIKALEDKNKTG